MQRPSRPFFLLSACVSVALAAWLLGSGAGGDVHEPRSETPTRGEPGAPPTVSASLQADVPLSTSTTRSRLLEPGPEPLLRGPDLADDELRAQLRRVAAVELADGPAFEAVLRPILTNGDNVERVLHLLRAHGLSRDGSTLSPEEVGALRTLGAAAVVFTTPPAESPLAVAGLALDGRAFLVDVLEALVDIAAPAQGILAGMLGASRDGAGRLLVGLDLATELDRLAAQHPEEADLYLGLLAEAARELDGTAARSLDLLQLTDERSPTLVNASLSRFLEGEECAVALQWAESLYDSEETEDGLRRAITTAVAAAAPVDDAATFLSARADAGLLVEFDLLGEREGGLEALEDEYYALRVFDDADETARTMLVAGMGRAPTPDLLAIAVDDASARVRGQAWTTLTLGDDFEPSARTLDLLHEGFVNRGDRDLGIPAYAAITAAANFAVHASSRPELQQRAVELLRTIAEDAEVSAHDRRKAIAKLERYLSPAEVARLRALVP